MNCNHECQSASTPANVVEFRIENFSKLLTNRSSKGIESKTIGHCRGFFFRLLVHPRGADADSSQISVFLEAVRQSWYPDDWVFPNVRFELSIVNVLDSRDTVTSWAHWTFTEDTASRGWQKMLPQNKLTKARGFLDEEDCLIVRGRADPIFKGPWSRKAVSGLPDLVWSSLSASPSRETDSSSVNDPSSPDSASPFGPKRPPEESSELYSSPALYRCLFQADCRNQTAAADSLLRCIWSSLVPSLKSSMHTDYVTAFVHILYHTKEFRYAICAYDTSGCDGGSMIYSLQMTFARMMLWPLVFSVILRYSESHSAPTPANSLPSSPRSSHAPAKSPTPAPTPSVSTSLAHDVMSSVSMRKLHSKPLILHGLMQQASTKYLLYALGIRDMQQPIIFDPLLQVHREIFERIRRECQVAYLKFLISESSGLSEDPDTVDSSPTLSASPKFTDPAAAASYALRRAEMLDCVKLDGIMTQLFGIGGLPGAECCEKPFLAGKLSGSITKILELQTHPIKRSPEILFVHVSPPKSTRKGELFDVPVRLDLATAQRAGLTPMNAEGNAVCNEGDPAAKWYCLLALVIKDTDSGSTSVTSNTSGTRSSAQGSTNSSTGFYVLIRPEEEGLWYRICDSGVDPLYPYSGNSDGSKSCSPLSFSEFKCHRDFLCVTAVYVSEDYIDSSSDSKHLTDVNLRQLNPDLYEEAIESFGLTRAQLESFLPAEPDSNNDCLMNTCENSRKFKASPKSQASSPVSVGKEDPPYMANLFSRLQGAKSIEFPSPSSKNTILSYDVPLTPVRLLTWGSSSPETGIPSSAVKFSHDAKLLALSEGAPDTEARGGESTNNAWSSTRKQSVELCFSNASCSRFSNTNDLLRPCALQGSRVGGFQEALTSALLSGDLTRLEHCLSFAVLAASAPKTSASVATVALLQKHTLAIQACARYIQKLGPQVASAACSDNGAEIDANLEKLWEILMGLFEKSYSADSLLNSTIGVACSGSESQSQTMQPPRLLANFICLTISEAWKRKRENCEAAKAHQLPLNRPVVNRINSCLKRKIENDDSSMPISYNSRLPKARKADGSPHMFEPSLYTMFRVLNENCTCRKRLRVQSTTEKETPSSVGSPATETLDSEPLEKTLSPRQLLMRKRVHSRQAPRTKGVNTHSTGFKIRPAPRSWGRKDSTRSILSGLSPSCSPDPFTSELSESHKLGENLTKSCSCRGTASPCFAETGHGEQPQRSPQTTAACPPIEFGRTCVARSPENRFRLLGDFSADEHFYAQGKRRRSDSFSKLETMSVGGDYSENVTSNDKCELSESCTACGHPPSMTSLIPLRSYLRKKVLNVEAKLGDRKNRFADGKNLLCNLRSSGDGPPLPTRCSCNSVLLEPRQSPRDSDSAQSIFSTDEFGRSVVDKILTQTVAHSRDPATFPRASSLRTTSLPQDCCEVVIHFERDIVGLEGYCEEQRLQPRRVLVVNSSATFGSVNAILSKILRQSFEKKRRTLSSDPTSGQKQEPIITPTEWFECSHSPAVSGSTDGNSYMASYVLMLENEQNRKSKTRYMMVNETETIENISRALGPSAGCPNSILHVLIVFAHGSRLSDEPNAVPLKTGKDKSTRKKRNKGVDIEFEHPGLSPDETKSHVNPASILRFVADRGFESRNPLLIFKWYDREQMELLCLGAAVCDARKDLECLILEWVLPRLFEEFPHLALVKLPELKRLAKDKECWEQWETWLFTQLKCQADLTWTGSKTREIRNLPPLRFDSFSSLCQVAEECDVRESQNIRRYNASLRKINKKSGSVIVVSWKVPEPVTPAPPSVNELERFSLSTLNSGLTWFPKYLGEDIAGILNAVPLWISREAVHIRQASRTSKCEHPCGLLDILMDLMVKGGHPALAEADTPVSVPPRIDQRLAKPLCSDSLARKNKTTKRLAYLEEKKARTFMRETDNADKKTDVYSPSGSEAATTIVKNHTPAQFPKTEPQLRPQTVAAFKNDKKNSRKRPLANHGHSKTTFHNDHSESSPSSDETAPTITVPNVENKDCPGIPDLSDEAEVHVETSQEYSEKVEIEERFPNETETTAADAVASNCQEQVRPVLPVALKRQRVITNISPRNSPASRKLDCEETRHQPSLRRDPSEQFFDVNRLQKRIDGISLGQDSKSILRDCAAKVNDLTGLEMAQLISQKWFYSHMSRARRLTKSEAAILLRNDSAHGPASFSDCGVVRFSQDMELILNSKDLEMPSLTHQVLPRCIINEILKFLATYKSIPVTYSRFPSAVRHKDETGLFESIIGQPCCRAAELLSALILLSPSFGSRRGFQAIIFNILQSGAELLPDPKSQENVPSSWGFAMYVLYLCLPKIGRKLAFGQGGRRFCDELVAKLEVASDVLVGLLSNDKTHNPHLISCLLMGSLVINENVHKYLFFLPPNDLARRLKVLGLRLEFHDPLNPWDQDSYSKRFPRRIIPKSNVATAPNKPSRSDFVNPHARTSESGLGLALPAFPALRSESTDSVTLPTQKLDSEILNQSLQSIGDEDSSSTLISPRKRRSLPDAECNSDTSSSKVLSDCPDAEALLSRKFITDDRESPLLGAVMSHTPSSCPLLVLPDETPQSPSRTPIVSSAAAPRGRSLVWKDEPQVLADSKTWLVVCKPAFWHCSGPSQGVNAESEIETNKDGHTPEAIKNVSIRSLVCSGKMESFHLWMMKKFPELETVKEWSDLECGLCHRIDLETSGALLVAKTKRSRDLIWEQFRRRYVHKEYLLLCHGRITNKQGTVKTRLLTKDYGSTRSKRIKSHYTTVVAEGGETALTEYHVCRVYQRKSWESIIECLKKNPHKVGEFAKTASDERNPLHSVPVFSECLSVSGRLTESEEYTLCKCRIITGRTHQIRVHMQHIGHPLVSDTKYLNTEKCLEDRQWCPRMFLHAAALEFADPDEPPGSFTEAICPLAHELQRALTDALICIEDYDDVTMYGIRPTSLSCNSDKVDGGSLPDLGKLSGSGSFLSTYAEGVSETVSIPSNLLFSDRPPAKNPQSTVKKKWTFETLTYARELVELCREFESCTSSDVCGVLEWVSKMSAEQNMSIEAFLDQCAQQIAKSSTAATVPRAMFMSYLMSLIRYSESDMKEISGIGVRESICCFGVIGSQAHCQPVTPHCVPDRARLKRIVTNASHSLGDEFFLIYDDQEEKLFFLWTWNVTAASALNFHCSDALAIMKSLSAAVIQSAALEKFAGAEQINVETPCFNCETLGSTVVMLEHMDGFPRLPSIFPFSAKYELGSIKNPAARISNALVFCAGEVPVPSSPPPSVLSMIKLNQKD